MITVGEADEIILGDIKEFPSVKIPLQEAFGMVLREDLHADRDLPPFNRVAMDGIAIQFASWQSGKRSFPIEGIQPAGSPVLTMNNVNACIEVMTGAILPQGCDCVIPVENISVQEGRASLREGFKLSLMMNVHQQGSDYISGTPLVAKGCRLLSLQIAVAASIGKDPICVTQFPKIAVIGTGDELVAVDQTPLPHQIRQSNSYALKAAMELHGYRDVTRFHMRDDKAELCKQLGEILEIFDIIVLSGGVSMGKFDYIPEVLKELGVEVLFHKVKQRPGKPFWFGKNGQGKPVFALPGNPVATQIGVYRYVLPYLDKATQYLKTSCQFAALDCDVEVKVPLTYFLPVQIIHQPDGLCLASPIFPHGSGDYASLVKSDGFLTLPGEVSQFAKGMSFPLYKWH